jgi:hypothetical protein
LKSKYIRAIGIDLGPVSSIVSDRYNLLVSEDTARRKTT